MRRARVLASMLALLALVAATPAVAASVTVVMTGDWFQVAPSVTDGSITTGGSFTVTLTYDDSTLDSDPFDPTVGSYLLPGATSSLTLATGNYTFTLLASEGIIFGVSDDWFGQDDFNFFAENFTTSGPGITTGYGYMNPLVVDSTQTAHSSDALTGLPWSVGSYDSPNLGMNFIIAVDDADPLELFGDFTEFSVLPEPSLLALAGLAGVVLLTASRRG